MNINEEYISRIAVNESAYKNGISLVKSKSYLKYCISQDGSVIFSECSGSAKTPYFVSVDFIDKDNPIFFCTCPSRQTPCKHVLGLLHAYSINSKFNEEEIPSQIQEKREKALIKKEKKELIKSEAPKPKKTNHSAEKKKLSMQLEGLNILEKLIFEIVTDGLGSIDRKKVDLIDSQSKQLGNYYLIGAQNMLSCLINSITETDKELSYIKSMEYITKIYAFIKKSREYINTKISNPELKRDTTSNIEALIGYAWQLSDLEEAGLYEDNAQLVQLNFTSYDDASRNELVDEAVYINLNDSKIYKTYNYRPYKAVKYITEEDSLRSLVLPKRMYIYPGDMNKRIRWESADFCDLNEDIIEKVKLLAKTSLNEIIKEAKAIFKNPLAEKDVIILFHYKNIIKIEDEYAIQDSNGDLLSLNKENIPLILNLNDSCEDGYMLINITKSHDNQKIYAEPLSLILNNKVIEISF